LKGRLLSICQCSQPNGERDMCRNIAVLFLACATFLIPVAFLRADDEPTADERVPDFKLSSKAFHSEYLKNEMAFARKYAGKIVELTGVVVGGGSVEVKPFPRVSLLTLEGGNIKKGDLRLPHVGCGMRSEVPVPWKRAKPGQTARIIGMMPLVVADSALGDCVILEVKGEGPPTITAEDLAAELRKNRAVTNKKYKDRWLSIEGTIAKVVSNETVFTISLQTKQGDPTVECDGIFMSEEQFEKLKPGTKLQTFAKYPDVNLTNQIYLSNGLLVD
jgi:hypothetical protein